MRRWLSGGRLLVLDLPLSVWSMSWETGDLCTLVVFEQYSIG